jgi:hypothetical protein
VVWATLIADDGYVLEQWADLECIQGEVECIDKTRPEVLHNSAQEKICERIRHGDKRRDDCD